MQQQTNSQHTETTQNIIIPANGCFWEAHIGSQTLYSHARIRGISAKLYAASFNIKELLLALNYIVHVQAFSTTP